MIREEKFNKKMDANRKRGATWFRNVSSGTEFLKRVVVVPASFKVSIPCFAVTEIKLLGKLWTRNDIVKINSQDLTGCFPNENYFSPALKHLFDTSKARFPAKNMRELRFPPLLSS